MLNKWVELFICTCAQMQRSRSGDRQPPQGGGAVLGKEIMKAEQYPTMGKVMELMRGTEDQHYEREQSIWEPEHVAAGPRSRVFAEVPGQSSVQRYVGLTQLPPVRGGLEETN